MAERRMFAKTIIDSDAFLEMPLSTQVLYFHLSMRADDEGFINNPKKIQRMIGASEDDLKLLIMKNFILPFESGVVVIKHWKIHNYIRNDRYKQTVYSDEKSLLKTKENGAYTFGIPSDNQLVYQMDTNGIPVDNQLVYQMDTQDRIGKDRIGKDRIDYDIIVQKFNAMCLSLPKVTIISDKRKKAMDKVFVKDAVVSIEYLDTLFDKVEKSDFLTGRTGTWKANFDWVMNPTNIAKIIDGNYDNHKKHEPSKDNKFNNFKSREYNWDDLESQLLNKGE